MSETEAGREMDAEVAEKVMGYHREIVAPDVNGEHGGNDVLVPPGETLSSLEELLPRKGPAPLWFFVRGHYSTDRAAALEVVDRLTESGVQVDVQNTGTATVVWIAALLRLPVFVEGPSTTSFPLAICRATLDPAVLAHLNSAREEPQPNGEGE